MPSGIEKTSQLGLKNLKTNSDPCEEWCKSLQKTQNLLEDTDFNKKLSSGTRITKGIDNKFSPTLKLTPEQEEKLKKFQIPELPEIATPQTYEPAKTHQISPDKNIQKTQDLLNEKPNPEKQPQPKTTPSPCDCTKYINV